MKRGSVYQRHTRSCPPAVDGERPSHRCRSPWAFQIDYGRDTSGKRKQVTKTGFATKAAARTALEEMSGALVGDVEAHRLTVAEYLNSWLVGKHALKPKTQALYRHALDAYIVPNLGTLKLVEVRAHHLDRFYAAIAIGRRGRPLSPSSIRRIHAVLSSAFTTAMKRRLIAFNPTSHIELAPEVAKRPTPWTLEEVQTFLDATSKDRLATLYHLMLVTGLRRGEAIGLRWEDVHLDRRRIFVQQQITEINGRSVIGSPKSRRGLRVVPIDAETVEALRAHAERQREAKRAWGTAWIDSGLVFTREDGSAIRPEYATRHFQALAARAGLPRIRLHDLRHTNASLALDAGIDIKVVSHRLGHATTAITQDLYTHVSARTDEAAAERIADLLRRPSETDASTRQARDEP